MHFLLMRIITRRKAMLKWFTFRGFFTWYSTLSQPCRLCRVKHEKKMNNNIRMKHKKNPFILQSKAKEQTTRGRNTHTTITEKEQMQRRLTFKVQLIASFGNFRSVILKMSLTFFDLYAIQSSLKNTSSWYPGHTQSSQGLG